MVDCVRLIVGCCCWLYTVIVVGDACELKMAHALNHTEGDHIQGRKISRGLKFEAVGFVYCVSINGSVLSVLLGDWGADLLTHNMIFARFFSKAKGDLFFLLVAVSHLENGKAGLSR